MPQRILHLGCSHLSCSYTKTDDKESDYSYARHLYELHNQCYSAITIPNPAQGIAKIATIIKHMDENNQLRFFSHCILQLTSEPRKVHVDREAELAQLANIHQLITGVDRWQDGYPSSVRNKTLFNNNQRWLYEKFASNFKDTVFGKIGLGSKTVDFRNSWLDVSKEISEGIDKSVISEAELTINLVYIKTMLEKHNIKLGIFDWWGQDHSFRVLAKKTYWKDEYLLHDYKSISEIMKENGDWDRPAQSNLGHMNKEQSLIVAKIIKRGMDDHKFLH